MCPTGHFVYGANCAMPFCKSTLTVLLFGTPLVNVCVRSIQTYFDVSTYIIIIIIIDNIFMQQSPSQACSWLPDPEARRLA